MSRFFHVCRWLTVAGLVCSIAVMDLARPADELVRPITLDRGGVLRWSDTGAQVALYGANYCIMSGSDYRMSGLVSSDRKAMIDEDMAHFARMGWHALRLCSWGDWENSDAAGNLIVNEHVDLLDYLMAAARKRGIYMLLTPIHTYDPAFADQLDKPSANEVFSRYFQRSEMGTNPRSIAAQVNYITQLLGHVNPYTGLALKDDPAIPFIEMINEPVHHPEDMRGSIDYINALVGAVRASGSRQITFFNVSQDFAIAPAIQQSQVQGVSFGWYPTSLVAGHQLHGNFLPAVAGYPDMLRPELAGRPRIVYEFDQADVLSGYLYPAMARTFHSVGAQFATMFAYDMLRTAPYNLGWQTHYLNLVHTPRKAVSAVIAAETLRTGSVEVSYDEDSSRLDLGDAFMNTGTTAAVPRSLASLRRIVGFGSSGVVSYEGTGAYFLDRIRKGVWRLEVYPDQVTVRDPFEQPRPDKVVSRLLYRSWPMTVRLPDLGGALTFLVSPGVRFLTRDGSIRESSLPSAVNGVGIDEFHVNERVEYPDLILSLAPGEFLDGSSVDIRVRVANTVLPDEVLLWLRPAGARVFASPVAMGRLQGNDYHAAVPSLKAGLYEFAVSSRTGARVSTFPGGVPQLPNQWPFQTDSLWRFRVTPSRTPLRLFDPRSDYPKLSFVRVTEQYRSPFFSIVPGSTSDESALYLSLPDLGADTPQRYAAALFVGETIAARASEAAYADALEVKSKGGGFELTLIEKDGTAFSVPVPAVADWAVVRIPLSALRPSRSIHIPSPYPGLWNYWRVGPSGRSDGLHVGEVERIQLMVSPGAGGAAAGVAVESIRLDFKH